MGDAPRTFDLSERPEYRSWKAGTSRLHYIQRCLDGYFGRPVNTQLSPAEPLNDEWYFDAGVTAVQSVVKGHCASELGNVRRVLDVPCGHGRVLRHLVNLFLTRGGDALRA